MLAKFLGLFGWTLVLLAVACGSSSSGNDPEETAMGGSSSGAGGTTASNGAGGSTPSSERFSFFVTSLEAMRALSGSQSGFGGDLRYGETGAGAGLLGADKICTAVAERSSPGNGKTWRAFLSATNDGTGAQVNAIDRIGEGPWYDRLGRLLAASKANLQAARPIGADTTIVNDLPNEDGVPNHAPDGTQVDNHDVLTGTNAQGQPQGASSTCSDWTSSAGDTSRRPRCGHSWPRAGGMPGGMPGGGGGNMDNWMSALDESGCAPGVNLIETGGPGNDGTVGSGGGYGGIYCFALTP
jgi:hypothetical protein